MSHLDSFDVLCWSELSFASMISRRVNTLVILQLMLLAILGTLVNKTCRCYTVYFVLLLLLFCTFIFRFWTKNFVLLRALLLQRLLLLFKCVVFHFPANKFFSYADNNWSSLVILVLFHNFLDLYTKRWRWFQPPDLASSFRAFAHE